jgi:hypothetical protein
MKKKIIKAKLGMGIIGVAADAFKNSQTVRDIGGNLGLIPKLLSDKYNKEEEEKEKQLRASQQVAEGGYASVAKISRSYKKKI